jgi:hypothetical protein
VAQLEACGRDRATLIARDYLDRRADSLTRDEAGNLLTRAQAHSKAVNPERLGFVGPLEDYVGYSKPVRGVRKIDSGRGGCPGQVPHVIEAWARPATRPGGRVCVNRSPVTCEVLVKREPGTKKKYVIHGCNLGYLFNAYQDRDFDVLLNVICPYLPVTTDGKEPDLDELAGDILKALEAAVSRAHKATKADPPGGEEEAKEDGKMRLPSKRRGATDEQRAQYRAQYQSQLKQFAERLKEIRKSMTFKAGTRGWCYILEEHGLTKGDFDTAEGLINDCRKAGHLPIDFVAVDETRAASNLETVHDQSPKEYGQERAEKALAASEKYLPKSLWEDQEVYIEMVVEKIDLKTLFEPVCAKYHVPIWNGRGWSDLNGRAAMMRRFKEHEAAGRTCVLLYGGDFDPKGLHISDFLMPNLQELSGAVGWDPKKLVIDRFGLNYDFITRHKLTWIENLITSGKKDLGSDKHPWHDQDWVQDYIKRYGKRKCEANALVVRPQAGQRLCEQAILKYIDQSAVKKYKRWLAKQRKAARAAMPDAFQAALDDADGQS